MRSFLVFFVFLIFFGCATGSKTVQKEESIKEIEANKFGIKAIHKGIYKLGEMVIISIENSSDTIAYLFQPNYLTIQKQIDTNWIDLRTLPCPCGAPCAPPGWQPLEPYQELDLHWDQRETWCDESFPNPREQLKTKEVEPGIYRWLINTNNTQDEGNVDNEFLLLEFRID